MAIACCGVNDPARWPLYERVRAAAYGALRERPTAEPLVMTNALCEGSPREREAWAHVVALARARGVPLVPVVLEAKARENEWRLRSVGRAGRKLTDPARLRAMRAADAIQTPDVPELLVLDTTDLRPDEVGEAIERHVRAVAWDECL